MMSQDENLIEIESKIAHQDRTIQILGEEIFKLQQKLEHLESTCNFLAEQVKQHSSGSLATVTDIEKPPHY